MLYRSYCLSLLKGNAVHTYITEVVAIVAEISGADEESLMVQIIADSRKLAALKAYAEAA